LWKIHHFLSGASNVHAPAIESALRLLLSKGVVEHFFSVITMLPWRSGRRVDVQ
jgi:hypothetical protein